MFISIIVILISVRTCTAQVATCKDDNNDNHSMQNKSSAKKFYALEAKLAD
ncbi:hypothetical protein T09_5189 [Trichinella sp. T9]|nr:hypothetical protein T09_5189 [Trichinella sp. T9]